MCRPRTGRTPLPVRSPDTLRRSPALRRRAWCSSSPPVPAGLSRTYPENRTRAYERSASERSSRRGCWDWRRCKKASTRYRRCGMKAIVVTDEAAGTAGMTLVGRPEPPAAINDVVVQVHASGFVPTETAWPSTWTDRRDRDRTPSIPGHELAGVVASLGYGTTGLSVGQRVFGLTDWHRDGTLAEYVAVEA